MKRTSPARLGITSKGIRWSLDKTARLINAFLLLFYGLGATSSSFGQNANNSNIAVFTGLGFLPGGGLSSSANAVSADGTVVVGSSATASGGNQAFRWTAQGGMQALGYLPGGGNSSVAYAVSSNGSVVVGQSDSSASTKANCPDQLCYNTVYPVSQGEAFQWTAATGMVGLGFLGTVDLFSSALGVSGDGSTIVGWSAEDFTSPDGLVTVAAQYAFRWTPQQGMVGATGESTLFAVSGDGTVAAGIAYDIPLQGLVWTPSGQYQILSYFNPINGTISRCYAVSYGGRFVVGSAEGGPSALQPMSYDLYTGEVSQLGFPPGGITGEAHAVSGDGSVVVGFANNNINQQAFLWDNINGSRYLADVLTQMGANLAGWSLTSAQGISSDGRTIVGMGIDPSGHTEAWMAILPRLVALRVTDASQANVSAADAIDKTITPVTDPNVLASAQPLGMGVVADDVTPVLFQLAAPAGSYTIQVTSDADSYNNGTLASHLSVLSSGQWNPTVSLSATSFGGGSTAYFYLGGLTWADFNGTPSNGVTLTVTVIPAGSSYAVASAQFLVRPPPVALVHGIADNNTTWSSEFLNELQLGIPPDFIIPVQYGVGPGSDSSKWPNTYERFDVLSVALDNSLQQNFEAPLRANWAFTRYDAVGHSQGGVLLRMLCQINSLGMGQFTAGNVPVVSKANLFRGRFRRVITIGSPHNGSLVAWYTLQLAFASGWRYEAPYSVLANHTPDKFDPFNPIDNQIQEINNPDLPADGRIRFNCIQTTIAGGIVPDSAHNPPFCYSFLGLSDIISAGRCRGSYLLPRGSDGVVDFDSQGGGPSTYKTTITSEDIAHANITFPLFYNLQSGLLDTVFGVPFNSQSQTIEETVASSVGTLLSGPATAFGPFQLPALHTQAEELTYLGILPRTIFQDLISEQPTPNIPTTNLTYVMQVPTNLPLAGTITWFVQNFGTNGASNQGVVLLLNTSNSTIVTVSVTNLSQGTIVLYGSYSDTNGDLVFANPVVVASYLPAPALSAIQFIPGTAYLLPGDTLLPSIWSFYSNGVSNLLYIPSGQAQYSSSNTNVANIGSDGTVTAIAPGVATIYGSFSGLTAQAVVEVTKTVVCYPVAESFATYASTVLSYQPLAYFQLNESSLPLPADVVSNAGSLGFLGNGFPFNTVSQGEPGIVSNCASFSNPSLIVGYLGSYVDIPYNSALNTSGPFTVEFWAKPNQYTTDYFCPISSIDVTENGSASREGWIFYQTPGDQWMLRVGNQNGYVAAIAGGTVQTNVWQHVAGIYDGTNVSLYVDGVEVAGPTLASGYSPNTNQTVTVRIGATSFGNRTFDGSMDEVAVYTKTLSAQSIMAHYQAAVTNNAGYGGQVLASQPAGYWHLDESAFLPPLAGTLPTAFNIGSLSYLCDGTYQPGSIPGVAGVPDCGFGNSNLACAFEGTSYIDVPGAPLQCTGALTLTAWINTPLTSGQDQSVLSLGASSYRLTVDGLGRPHFADGAQPFGDLVGPNQIDDNQWHHLVGIYDGTNVESLYVDGRLAAQSTNATVLPAVNSNDFWIGGDPDPGEFQFFNGVIDEVAILTNALSADQTLWLYSTGFNATLLSAAVHSPRLFALTWHTILGQVYQVEQCTDLSQNNWSFLGATITATNSTMTISMPIGTNSQQFFRVLLLPNGTVSASSPGIIRTSLSGSNLVLSGTNGQSGSTYYVLTSTNLALPLSQWTPVATNMSSANGNFTITVTNTVTRTVPQRFYILQTQ